MNLFNKEGGAVNRLNGSFFYRLAGNLDPLCRVNADTTKAELYSAAYFANMALGQIVDANEMLRLKASWGAMESLRGALNTLILEELTADESDLPIGVSLSTNISGLASNFRSVFLGEIQTGDYYAVSKKGAYDTTLLAESGASAFPSNLVKKVPDTASDAKQAARCLAFDLPTAAAFHMHRANEAVIHAYYKALAPAKTPPHQRAMEHWLKAIEAEPKHDPKIMAALRDLKDLHRNPVSHPEQSLEDSDEAIALLGAIHTAMTHMLKAIP